MTTRKRYDSKFKAHVSLEAIYPKPNLSRTGNVSVKYPYLLKGLIIDRPNHVWSTDITYIRLRQGFIYLVAVMDWFSPSFRLGLCPFLWGIQFFGHILLHISTGKSIPERNSGDIQQRPGESIHQWSVYCSFRVLRNTHQLGRSRSCSDNIFIERLWRSVKYEEVYLKDYANVKEAITGLSSYFMFYNTERLHQSLGYRTPQQVYFDAKEQWRFNWVKPSIPS